MVVRRLLLDPGERHLLRRWARVVKEPEGRGRTAGIGWLSQKAEDVVLSGLPPLLVAQNYSCCCAQMGRFQCWHCRYLHCRR